MTLDRRDFLTLTSAGATATLLPAGAGAAAGLTEAGGREAKVRWIWYPGQLAAYRHQRRMKLAVERCTMVGYPGNFRQPVTQAFFRKSGVAERDLEVRWAAPTGRLRLTLGKAGFDITLRKGQMKKGASGIYAHIDFADSLPCLWLEADGFSTDETWEASLDGQTWVPAEVSEAGDPEILPDTERTLITPLAAYGPETQDMSVSQLSLHQGQDAVVDFREIELGYLRFDVSGSGQLQIQVGETLPEVRDPDEKAFEQKPLRPIPLSDKVQSVILPERAVRYARFFTTGTARIDTLRFDAKRWPVPPQGYFQCSDPELTAVWDLSVATLRSNLHDFILDGIRRDGLVWHDGPLCLEACERVFFDADIARQTLIAQTLPENPTVEDVGIIDGPMYSLIGFERELMARGDARFSRLFRDRIEDIARFYLGLQDQDGFVNAARVEPYGYFPDWSATRQSGPDTHGAPTYGQMLLSQALRSAGVLARAWGDEAASTDYLTAAARLRASIRQKLRGADGLYVNGVTKAGDIDPRPTSFAQAFAVAFDIAETNEQAPLFAFLNDYGRRPDRFSLSQVVELEAYARAGRADEAVARLRLGWVPLVRQGYRRFFEDIRVGETEAQQRVMYSRKYGRSLCHAWAGAAPVMALSRGVLGVQATEPGYRRCHIAPQACGLEWVKGAVPTPYGLIVVEWQGRNGQVTIPAGITANVMGKAVITGPAKVRFTPKK